MRLIVLLPVALIWLSGCATLVPPHPPEDLVGLWQSREAGITHLLHLKADGTFDLDVGANLDRDARGDYKIRNNEISFVTTTGRLDPGCQATGRYAFQILEGRLLLGLVHDPCSQRRTVLTESNWQRNRKR